VLSANENENGIKHTSFTERHKYSQCRTFIYIFIYKYISFFEHLKIQHKHWTGGGENEGKSEEEHKKFKYPKSARSLE